MNGETTDDESRGSARVHSAAKFPDGEEQRARDAAYGTLHERQPWGPREKLWDYDVRGELGVGQESPSS